MSPYCSRIGQLTTPAPRLVTSDTALRLASYFAMPQEFWLNLPVSTTSTLPGARDSASLA